MDRFYSSWVVLAAIEKGQQRTWDHIPIKETACGKNTQIQLVWPGGYPPLAPTTTINVLVEMRNTCQVTNQSSHGELSFHHNPHPSALLGLVPLYFSRYSERGYKNETCSSPTYCHCCELCALKQKPGVLLANNIRPEYLGVLDGNYTTQIPTADRTHHRIRSPSIKCSGT